LVARLALIAEYAGGGAEEASDPARFCSRLTVRRDVPLTEHRTQHALKLTWNPVFDVIDYNLLYFLRLVVT
jgi:hypothetical protein